MKQILEHHHIDQGVLAVPLPQDLHRGSGGNYSKWHNAKEKKND